MKDVFGRSQYLPLAEKEKIRIVFLLQQASVWPSWESFFYACRADGEIDVTLMLLNKTSVEKIPMLTSEKFLKNSGLEFEYFNMARVEEIRPHIVVIQTPYDLSHHTSEALSIRFQSREMRVVYIPYGIEIADTAMSRLDHFESFVVKNSWRVFTCSDAIVQEYQKYCCNREAVRVCGSPKFDGLAQKEKFPLNDEIVKKADGRKIIVWKMHFPRRIRENGKIVQQTPELEVYLEFAKKLENYSNVFFVVLPHPKMLGKLRAYDMKGKDDIQDQLCRLLESIRAKENAYIDASDDYRNSLYHADAIIIDRSAVVIEAAMTGKPELMMINADFQESWTNGVRQVIGTLRKGYTAQDMEAFVEDIRKGQLGANEETERALAQYFPYRDGKCGERIKEVIKRELREEQSKQKQKPRVVLYGMGEVCRYYLEEEQFAENREWEVTAVIDSNKGRIGEVFCGYSIEAPEKLYQTEYDCIVIMSEPYYLEIKKMLVYEMHIDERKIWRLDEFLEVLQKERA